MAEEIDLRKELTSPISKSRTSLVRPFKYVPKISLLGTHQERDLVDGCSDGLRAQFLSHIFPVKRLKLEFVNKNIILPLSVADS